MFKRTCALLGVLCALWALQIPVAATNYAVANAGKHACIQHWPNAHSHIHYAKGCTGHDEPELFPVSNAPGSAQTLDWMFTMPQTLGKAISNVGPAFWVGGTVTDKASLNNQAFFELQFYPDNKTGTCGGDGSFDIHYVPGAYTVCSPVWAVTKDGYNEYAAFNAMLKNNSTHSEMVFHAGETVCVHQHSEKDGLHLDVINMSKGNRTGTIVLNSKTDGGALLPPYSQSLIGNHLLWGATYGAPNAFSWEIGHMSINSYQPVGDCNPGDSYCPSYNASQWQHMGPLNLQVETANDKPFQHFAVASSQGGMGLVQTTCGPGEYPNKSYCTYPFWSSTTAGFEFGEPANGPGTYGNSYEFSTHTYCPSPYGARTQFCANALS